MDGPVGELVRVGVTMSVLVGVKVKVKVKEGVVGGSPVDVAVAVGKTGVDDALVTPITAGVGEKIEGVNVAGRKGVGPGWITQPPHADSKNVSKTMGISFFILFSSDRILSRLSSLP